MYEPEPEPVDTFDLQRLLDRHANDSLVELRVGPLRKALARLSYLEELEDER